MESYSYYNKHVPIEEQVKRARLRLSVVETNVIEHLFALGCDQPKSVQEVGERLGLSPARVVAERNNALRRLRAA